MPPPLRICLSAKPVCACGGEDAAAVEILNTWMEVA